MAKKTSVQFYYDYIEQLEDLDDKQFRKVVLAMVKYDEENELIELDKISKMAFNFIKKRIDYDKENYNEKCRKNKENIQNYWNKRKQTNTNEYERKRMYTKNTDIDIELELDEDIDIDNDDDLYNYIQKNFGRGLSPLEIETISEWEDNELTRYAIKQAILNGKYNFRYINSILHNYKKNNITTVQQAQENDREFKENKNKPKSYGKYQSMDDFNAVLERNKDEEE